MKCSREGAEKSTMEERIEIFISYAHEDEPLRQHLEKHLSTLKNQGIINVWHNRQIKAGEERNQIIDARLNAARIILLLISPDFMASTYCYGKEMEYAMKRHERKEACVIPIILRPIHWQSSPIGKLQVLPTEITSLTSGHNLDEAFFNVAEGIRQVIQSLPSSTGKEQKHLEQEQIAIEQHERSIEGPLTPSPLWSVPYSQNTYFTGRESLLEQLHCALSSGYTGSAMRKRAISGLGGVGKTQIALEYAYRYHGGYKAVFWIRAESRETLLADFMRIACLLNLIQYGRQGQTPTNVLSGEQSLTVLTSQSVNSVDFREVTLPNTNWYQLVGSINQWFSKYPDWLLIFDNVDNLAIIEEFIPKLGKGSILITCRMQSLGNIVTRPVEVYVMDLEEGMLFLLRRAGILSLEGVLDTISNDDRANASALVNELGGLPLALDQAGAYIQETRCDLSRYLNLYKKHSATLLKRRGASSEYSQSVATTWSLSFQNVEKNNPIAAEMLRLCAFLHPDAIPEDVFTEGKDDLGPVLSTVVDDPIALDEAIEALLRYSLVKRNAGTKTLTIHRLVQIVLKDTMSEEKRRQWSERTIRVCNCLFPVVKRGPVDMAQWPHCEQYLPHAQVCLVLDEQHVLMTLEAASLFHHVGCYLYLRGRYTEVHPFCERALMIREQLLGLEHPDVAESLDLLAALYHKQGRYADEEPLFQRIISYREKALGLEHPDLARSLYGLGKCYYRQGKYAEAESVLLQALAIFREALGTDNANTLSRLGILYWEHGRYAEAEPLLQQALTIFERVLGPTHPDVANGLTRLGILYKAQGRYTEALPLYQRALSILEKTLGAEHRDVAISLNNIGSLYYLQGKYTEVEPLWQRALSIFEKVLGSEHDHVGTSLNHLAGLYICMEKYAEAEPLLQRALTIHQKSLGIEHVRTINDLCSLGNLYTRQEKYVEAEQLLQQALALYEKIRGLEHPDVAESLINLGALYRKQGRDDKAKLLFQRALTVQEKVLGSGHPSTLATQEQYQSLLS